MAVQVQPADDADMDRIFEVGCLAFGRNEPMWDSAWPKHWTSAGRKVGAERMRLTKASDPNTTFLKAVDTSSDSIVGMAKWLIYDNVLPDRSTILGGDGDYWENEADRKYNERLWDVFLQRRDAAIARTNGKLVSLDVLAIDPEHQRKGVGDALVKWGTQKADELGYEAVVESSVFGKGLYEKNGFVFVKDVELRVPESGDRPLPRFAWLVRPKKV